VLDRYIREELLLEIRFSILDILLSTLLSRFFRFLRSPSIKIMGPLSL
jgi:hypothetical protein